MKRTASRHKRTYVLSVSEQRNNQSNLSAKKTQRKMKLAIQSGIITVLNVSLENQLKGQPSYINCIKLRNFHT